MQDFVAALAQIAPTLGDLQANLARHLEMIEQARKNGAAVVVFPELSLSGYLLRDQLPEIALRLDDPLLLEIAHASHDLDVVVGFPEESDEHRFHNSAAYFSGGECVHLHRKLYLPNYGMFEEGRDFAPGERLRRFDAPFGSAGLLICEDLWHPTCAWLLAQEGAQVIFVLSNGPTRGTCPERKITSIGVWEELLKVTAQFQTAFMVYVNRAGCEDGLSFGGGSVVVDPFGRTVGGLGPLDEGLVTVSLEGEVLRRARTAYPLLRDERLPLVARELGRIQRMRVRASRAEWRRGARAVLRSQPRHFNPYAEGDLSIDAPSVVEILSRFIRLEVRRTGKSKLVVGLSGGIDSAVSTYLAAHALGPQSVTCVLMPHRQSSPDSLLDARKVVAALGTKQEEIEITPIVEGFREVAGEVDALRLGNVMARARMILLFDRSAKHDALVLGTGNKTELLLGYTTLHGDMACALNPIGDLYKTQVRSLAEYLEVPSSIRNKPPSADLWPGQSDEQELGLRYAEVDRLLALLVDARVSPAKTLALGFSQEQIEDVVRRIRRSQFKRRPPLLAKASTRTIDWDFRYPRDWGS